MKQLAEIAGVSQTTVSRVLNGVAGSIPIARETQERVLQAARDFGYRPNPFARGLRGGQTGTIGLVVREAFDPFFSQLISFIGDEARKRDYAVVMGSAESQARNATELAWAFDTYHCDGMLLVGDLRDDSTAVVHASSHGRPTVALCVGRRLESVPSINTNNTLGVELAMDHLTQLGHRRIGIIHAWVGDHTERLEAYLRYMRQRSYSVPSEYIQPAGHNPQGGYAAASDLLRRSERPSAVFAANDMLAIGALKAAYDLGIRVPDELSIVGFDDMPFAEFVAPSLSTVRQPVNAMAALAVESLRKLISGDGAPQAGGSHILDPTLVVRQSTSRVPAS